MTVTCSIIDTSLAGTGYTLAVDIPGTILDGLFADIQATYSG